MNSPIIQVTNVAPTASKEQMKNLFSFLGKIEELKLYPSEDIPVPVKVCFVMFEDITTAGVAIHLNNTVFIDRALAISPYSEPVIPDEGLGMQISLQAATGTLPGNSASWPSNVVTKLQGTGTGQVISTLDPKLTALGLPQYPLLPANTDPTKIEEIRRTVYVGNLDSSVTAEQVLNFFTQAGEVKFVRMAGDESQPVRFAFVEFSDQRSIPTALTYNSVMFGGRPLKVNHSSNAIVKPHVKPETAKRELDEAMRRVKEAQSLISAAIDPGKEKSSRSRSRSRSRKRRSRSRSRKSASRRRSNSRRRSQRSRSRGRRSRSRKRSRSRSKTRRRSSRSRRKTPPRAYSHRKSRSTSRSRKRRSRSRTRKHRSKSVEKKKSTSKSPSPPKLKKEGSPNGSPVKDKNQLPPDSDKDSTSKAPPELENKDQSSSPRKKSRSRSPSLSKSKKGRRSSSPRRRSRSRSGSRHRQSFRSKRRRDRSRDRHRDYDRSKKPGRDVKEREGKDEVKVKRDYDEEEKGYTSPNRKEEVNQSDRKSPKKQEQETELQSDDMDVDTSD